MSRKILLLEPNYNNKYPPMGLMKIATYYRNRGDDVCFYKGDLKKFAAKLLFEEFYHNFITTQIAMEDDAPSEAELQSIKNDIAKYETKYIEYIKTGKHAPLEAISNLTNEKKSLIITYRQRYKNNDYPKFDIVCITTLFTFYWKKTVETINFAKNLCKKEKNIKVGGIAASLVADKMFEETGIMPFIGQLKTPEDLGDKRRKSDNFIIDELPLDYSILEEVDYKYPANNAYFAYMTRGCVNKCDFCAVPRLEPSYCNYINLKSRIEETDKRFGAKKDLLLLDNNAFASENFDQIIDEIKECGFGKGDTYIPPNEYAIAIQNVTDNFNLRAYTKKLISIYNEIESKLPEKESGDFYSLREELGLLYEITATKEALLQFDEVVKSLYSKYFKQSKRMRIIDFNQGMDARLATPEKMKKLAEINIRPLRIAFDHYSQKETYEKAIRLAAENGIKDLSNYLLYNFKDKPEELYYRMKLNVDLCTELNVTIYSFPMKYHPIDDPNYFSNRDFIGKHWNRKFIRAIQAVLNATKGKIGRGKTFFEEAFGQNVDEFQKILWMPETFIIYRRKYDESLRNKLGDRYISKNPAHDCNLTNEWWDKFNKLSNPKLDIVKNIILQNDFKDCRYECNDDDVLDVLSYYTITRDNAEEH